MSYRYTHTQLIKRWIDPVSVNKIQFISTEELQNFIPIENLPTEYGGTSGFSFSYVPPAQRNGARLYERGWEPETPEEATNTAPTPDTTPSAASSSSSTAE